MTTRTIRLIADGSGSAAAGTVFDLSLADATRQKRSLGARTYMMSGTTTQRPKASDGDFAGLSNIARETLFLDTTLGYIVVADGLGNWLNPNTGAKV